MNNKKIFMIGFVANILEWYDFSVFAYFAVIIGLVFFDEANKQIAFIKTLFIFSISFLIRPIGSFFFGYISDKFGRRLSLNLSLLIMAVPTFFIGLLPSYKTMGSFSIFCLIFLRIVQGFAAGGELPSTSCYLYEISPDKKKNFYCSFVASSSMLGVFLGSLSAYILNKCFSQIEIIQWAWRLPFLMGAVIFIVVFIIRKSIKETNQFKINIQHNNAQYFKLLFLYRTQIFQIFILNSFISVSFYLLFVWMPSYLHIFLNLPAQCSFLISSCGLFVLIISTLFIGWVSNNFNRIEWIALGVLLITFFSYPLFSLIKGKLFTTILFCEILFAIFLSCIDGVINATMGSLLEDKIRCTGISIGFTLSTGIFGGLSPTICSILINKTGLNNAPVFFLIIFGVMALAIIISLKKNHTLYA